MSETSATLLAAAACLFGVGVFALNHRRDALGAILAVVLGFDAVACALVGFAGLAASRAEAAQLQSFALLVQVVGVLFAAAGISLAAVLRRRTGGRDLLELAFAGPRPAASQEPGDDQYASVLEEPDAEEPEEVGDTSEKAGELDGEG